MMPSTASDSAATKKTQKAASMRPSRISHKITGTENKRPKVIRLGRFIGLGLSLRLSPGQAEPPLSGFLEQPQI